MEHLPCVRQEVYPRQSTQSREPLRVAVFCRGCPPEERTPATMRRCGKVGFGATVQAAAGFLASGLRCPATLHLPLHHLQATHHGRRRCRRGRLWRRPRACRHSVTPTQLGHSIQQLKERTRELAMQHKATANDVRDTGRRQSRLKKRTRLLTDEDLHQVLRMRGAPPPTEAPVPPSAEEAAPPP